MRKKWSTRALEDLEQRLRDAIDRAEEAERQRDELVRALLTLNQAGCIDIQHIYREMDGVWAAKEAVKAAIGQ